MKFGGRFGPKLLCKAKNRCNTEILRPLVVAIGVVASFGCQPPAPLPPPETTLTSLDLFISRSSLLSTDFEQYSLADNGLFGECGVLEHGRFVPKTQTLSDLTPDKRDALVTTAYGLQQMIDEKHPAFELPGTKASPFDPGTFSLKAELGGTPFEVKTSFDSVVNGETRATEQLRTLAKLVRDSAVDGCGANPFYGLRGAKR